MQSKNKIIGLTTTVPVEIIYAAGYKPVDLNNIFITSNDPEWFVDNAEMYGFPGNTCAWIKGIYSAVIKKNIENVIAPVWGDCSNTHALCDVLRDKNINIIEFAYPYDRSLNKLKSEIHRLMSIFGVSEADVLSTYKKLHEIRILLKKIDDYTIKGKITPFENHYYLINSSDFMGDIEDFKHDCEEIIIKAEKRNSKISEKKLGLVGVPPIFTDFYEFFEENNVSILFNEIQREFSMIRSLEMDFYSQYLNYTYPYGMRNRISNIKNEIKNRDLNGIIHYTQCFCFRQIEDIILKKNINIPVLTIEGDRPGILDARTKMRIENFLEII